MTTAKITRRRATVLMLGGALAAYGALAGLPLDAWAQKAVSPEELAQAGPLGDVALGSRRRQGDHHRVCLARPAPTAPTSTRASIRR